MRRSLSSTSSRSICIPNRFHHKIRLRQCPPFTTPIRYNTNDTDRNNTNKTDETKTPHDLGLNEGTIEGVWIFHRHGDRTPARSLVADHMYDSEAAFWKTKVPPSRRYYDVLSEKFPAKVEDREGMGTFLDAGREPYGVLTWKGMDQMYDKGRQFRRRYGNGNANKDFLEDWNVKVYSTNYLRTVMSAQCFLDGLIGNSTIDGHGIHPTNTNNNDTTNNRRSYEEVPLQEFIDHTNSTESIDVQVRSRQQDTLNAFDKHPQYMKKLVNDVVTTRRFISEDSKAAPLAARLANLLPGLSKASNYGGPSGINWIHAADHFVCRTSHSLNYNEFSLRRNEEKVERALGAMRHPTVAHLSWRFRMWYQSPPLLAAIAGPPLGEIDRHVQRAVNDRKNDDNDDGKMPMVVYSCHDVTLLSLLYGIGADFVSPSQELEEANVDPGSGRRWRYWPTYASTLAFELVRLDDDEGGGGGDGERMVRIVLNGKPVHVVADLKKKCLGRGEGEESGVFGLSTDDFSKIVKDLKERGNFKCFGKKDTKGDDGERDMSTWTG